MPYIPTPEKLQALGFSEGNDYLMAKAYLGGAEKDHLLIIYNDGQVKLKDDDGQRWMLALPSEAFFDELLTAVGWTR
jgi:hypothetical protein